MRGLDMACVVAGVGLVACSPHSNCDPGQYGYLTWGVNRETTGMVHGDPYPVAMDLDGTWWTMDEDGMLFRDGESIRQLGAYTEIASVGGEIWTATNLGTEIELWHEPTDTIHVVPAPEEVVSVQISGRSAGPRLLVVLDHATPDPMRFVLLDGVDATWEHTPVSRTSGYFSAAEERAAVLTQDQLMIRDEDGHWISDPRPSGDAVTISGSGGVWFVADRALHRYDTCVADPAGATEPWSDIALSPTEGGVQGLFWDALGAVHLVEVGAGCDVSEVWASEPLRSSTGEHPFPRSTLAWSGESAHVLGYFSIEEDDSRFQVTNEGFCL